jgi:hypothetical protein
MLQRGYTGDAMTEELSRHHSLLVDHGLLGQIADLLTPNGTLLIDVPIHAVIVICKICASHVLQELFIMGNDDELEILLTSTVVNKLVQ